MTQLETIAAGIKNGDIRALAKGITLIESRNPDHWPMAAELLNSLLPFTGQSIRIGISGVPGVGKSTFIEALGMQLINREHRIAVLAVDPTSQLSGGSILGDKTRMEELSRQQGAFIRPSPTGDTLGGVARKTRESMLLCEAAGYDILIVETVGVGQSEVAVAAMVDCFLLLQLPNAGDELQGIKRGVMEVADLLLINKADGESLAQAELARQQYQSALHLLTPKSANWQVPVLLCSALHRKGIDEAWQRVEDYIGRMQEGEEFNVKRQRQNSDWMWTLLLDELKERFLHDPGVAAIRDQVQHEVSAGQTTPGAAVKRLFEAFRNQHEPLPGKTCKH